MGVFVEQKRTELQTRGFNEQQIKAILTEEPLAVISAGAGSGKTRVLTERYIYLCERQWNSKKKDQEDVFGAAVDQIVAITFTKKAAREMRDRIRKALEAKRTQAMKQPNSFNKEDEFQFWTEQVEKINTAAITTFHSFCQKLIQEYPQEAKVLPHFTVMEELDSRWMKDEILEEMMNDAALLQNWNDLYSFYTPQSIKQSIIDCYGKIREMGEYKESCFDPKSIDTQYAISIQKKTELLRELYEMAKVNEPTFIERLENSILELEEKDRQKKKKEPSASIKHSQNLLDVLQNLPADQEDGLKRGIFHELRRIAPSAHKSWEGTPLHGFLTGFWRRMKNAWDQSPDIDAEDLSRLKKMAQAFGTLMDSFHKRYAESKKQRSVLDFADLQHRAISLFSQAEVRDECKKKFKHFMIDEFQDTNPLQMAVLNGIGPNYRFIVGDGKQSIYRFRGADVSLMKQLSRQSAEKKKEQAFIEMPTNYRTCEGIIHYINEVFNDIMGSEETDSRFSIHYTALDAGRKGEKERETRVELLEITPPSKGNEDQENEELDSISEYESVVSRMVDIYETDEKLVYDDHQKQWVKPQWKHMGILLSSRSQLTHLEMALTNRKIPYTVYGGLGFYERQEVMDMLTLLKWLARPWESLHILALLRGPLFGLDINDLLELHQAIPTGNSLSEWIYEGQYQSLSNADLKQKLEQFQAFYDCWVPFFPQRSMEEELLHLFEGTNLRTICFLQANGLQKVKNVEKLIHIMAGIQTNSLEEVLHHVKRLAELSEKEGEAEVELADGDAVHIMTVHASKGLEFPIVFVPNLYRIPRADSGSIRLVQDGDEKHVLIKYQTVDPTRPWMEKEIVSPLFHVISDRLKEEATEEYKRLFYVALTRARDYLVLSSKAKSKQDEDRADRRWYHMLQSARSRTRSDEFMAVRTDYAHERLPQRDTVTLPEPSISLQPIIPVTFSVSEVMDFMASPESYYERYILKLNPKWYESQEGNGGSSLDSLRLGTFVHRACELIDSGFNSVQAVDEALSVLEEEAEVLAYRQEVESLIQSYQSIDHEKLGIPVKNEWSFSLDLDGVYVIGTIDKVVKHGDKYHVIDIKTNKTDNLQRLIDKYRPQLYLYKLALEQVEGIAVDDMSLLFLRASDQLISVSDLDKKSGISGIYETKLKRAVAMMADLKRRDANREEYVAVEF